MPNIELEINHLLVVDTHPDDYLHLNSELRSSDQQLTFATSGNEALRMPNSLTPQAWLINFRLPDMTGPELLEIVRSRAPQSVCILISDTYSSAEELLARQLGATLYTCKPILGDWLNSLPSASKHRQDLRVHGPPRASPRGLSSRDIASAPPHPTQS